MPIIKPINYSCKKCDWTAVRMEDDILLTPPRIKQVPFMWRWARRKARECF